MNQKIINLRAFTIILIVLGHSIIIYDPTFDLLQSSIEVPFLAELKHLISFVQLKLFFMLSGFCFFYSYKKPIPPTPLNVAVQKFGRLIVPYAFVAVCWMDPIKYALGISGYSAWPTLLGEQAVGLNCGHLWYLPCLFMIFIIISLALTIRRTAWYCFTLLVLFAGLNYTSYRFPGIFQLSNACYYAVYFYFGYLLNYCLNNTAIRAFLSRKTSLVIIGCVTLLAGFGIHRYTSIGFDLYSSIIVIGVFYFITPKKTTPTVKFISDNSYGLYLFHSPLIYITATFIPNCSPWLMVFINFVIFGGIALGLSVLCSRTYLKYITGDLNLKLAPKS